MALKLFNTMSKEKEVFTPLEEGKVGMYCCGPTVYDFAHIGNLRTYIFEDILRRVLEYNDFEVNHVMNITDVGHLTDDGDSGEDKLEKGARREGKTVWDIAKQYTDAFFNDLSRLNIKTPTINCKATDHIQEMIDLIKKLEDEGYTYVSDGNVFFDISKFTYYRDLGRLNLDEMQETDRAISEGKRNPQDFALWFTKSKFENHAMKWDSPWGEGYPGWHIECSAMSSKYLGDQFDIHCGGVDHVQVHHTNEIAQSECATGKRPWVKYWVHGEFLIFNGGKMAKSGDSFVTLDTLIDKGFDPLVYRYYCLGTTYRQKLNFNWDALENAKTAFEKLKNKIIVLHSELSPEKDVTLLADDLSENETVLEFKDRFLEAINDDLNMPAAMALVHEVLKSDLDASEKLVLLYDFDNVFALGFSDMKNEEVMIDPELESLLVQREEARASKNWGEADKIRDEILSKGYVVKDTAEGPKLEKK